MKRSNHNNCTYTHTHAHWLEICCSSVVVALSFYLYISFSLTLTLDDLEFLLLPEKLGRPIRSASNIRLKDATHRGSAIASYQRYTEGQKERTKGPNTRPHENIKI